ncbi:MAG: hypothetical protein IJM09_00260 [Neisseriaceae bacterium]|nr:hypothetical protein [Neisseriaceae bacterium]
MSSNLTASANFFVFLFSHILELISNYLINQIYFYFRQPEKFENVSFIVVLYG